MLPMEPLLKFRSWLMTPIKGAIEDVTIPNEA